MGEILQAHDRRITDYPIIFIKDFHVVSPKEVPPILVTRGQLEKLTSENETPKAVRAYFESYPREREFAHIDGSVYRRPLDDEEILRYQDQNPNNKQWRHTKNWTPRLRQVLLNDPILKIYLGAIRVRVNKAVRPKEILPRTYGNEIGNVISTTPYLCLGLDLRFDTKLDRASRLCAAVTDEIVSNGCVIFDDPNTNSGKHALLDVLCKTETGLERLTSIGSIRYTGYLKGPVEED